MSEDNSGKYQPSRNQNTPLISPESKAGFDQLVQGIIDGEIMTCLSPAHRSALRKQFERDRQEIERLEESTFFYRREFESATERVNYRDEELITLRAKAERLERALVGARKTCSFVIDYLVKQPHDKYLVETTMDDIDQALEGK